MTTKTCNSCLQEKPITSFQPVGKKKNGEATRRGRCSSCRRPPGSHRAKVRRGSPETRRLRQRVYNAQRRTTLSIRVLSRVIREDSLKADAKRGFPKNEVVSADAIETIIQQGCSYCGSSCNEMRMTLDRLDNSRGHSEGNVVGACLRCNFIRRDMPIEAFLLLAPAIKEARMKGAFGDWVGGTSRKKKKPSSGIEPGPHPYQGYVLPFEL